MRQKSVKAEYRYVIRTATGNGCRMPYKGTLRRAIKTARDHAEELYGHIPACKRARGFGPSILVYSADGLETLYKSTLW